MFAALRLPLSASAFVGGLSSLQPTLAKSEGEVIIYNGEIQRVMSYSNLFEPKFAPILVNMLVVAADLMEEHAFVTEMMLILLAAMMLWMLLWRLLRSRLVIAERKSIGVQTMIDDNFLIQHLRAVASQWGLSGGGTKDDVIERLNGYIDERSVEQDV